jgi:predicted outer membrane repeat protein
VSIHDNEANGIYGSSGGGIYIGGENSNLTFSETEKCNIYSNVTNGSRGNGEDIYYTSSMIIEVVLDTFTVINPTDYYITPIESFSLDILNGYDENLINDNLYVSQFGDDENGGTSIDSPFKTIGHALRRVYADSLNINTIHIGEGVYSPTTNQEIFPLECVGFVNLSGASEHTTILDAEGTGTIIQLNKLVGSVSIENIKCINGNGYTGGALDIDESDVVIRNVILDNNTAEVYGGAINVTDGSSLNAENLIIRNNSSSWANALHSYDTDVNLVNTLIHNNTTTENGSNGGSIILYDCTAQFINTTIANNYVYEEQPYLGSSILHLGTSSLQLSNSIIWNNDLQNIGVQNSSLTVINSNIYGGLEEIYSSGEYSEIIWIGENINENPLFVDSENGDFNLQTGSPCIDAGTTDIDGDGYEDITNYNGSAPDMGAYESIAVIMAGDTNFDGIVDILDIVRIVNHIMGNSEFNDDELTTADFNADGIVDILDIVQIVNYILAN